MNWYWCSDFYEYGNIVKAKNVKEAKKIFYYYGDHADEMEWINIRCRKLQSHEYSEEWLEKHVNEYGSFIMKLNPTFLQLKFIMIEQGSQ